MIVSSESRSEKPTTELAEDGLVRRDSKIHTKMAIHSCQMLYKSYADHAPLQALHLFTVHRCQRQ